MTFWRNSIPFLRKEHLFNSKTDKLKINEKIIKKKLLKWKNDNLKYELVMVCNFHILLTMISCMQGGIITRILESRMQQSFEPRAKFITEVMQKHANHTKPICHTRYFGWSICSKSLGCGNNFMPPWPGVRNLLPISGLKTHQTFIHSISIHPYFV